MKKLALAVVLAAAIPAIAIAHTNPSYCGAGPYNTSYRAIYEYPTGTYWQNQIAHYPAYYAAHNAQYLNKYGCI